MLRLKGERHEDLDAFDEEMRPATPTMTRADEITRDDAFPADDPTRYDEEPGLGEEQEGVSPLRGLGIAAAAFVPTFLAAFIGLSYLLDPVTTARTPGEPTSVASAPLGAEQDPMLRGEPGSGAPLSATPRVPDTVPRVLDDPSRPERDSVRRDPRQPETTEPVAGPPESSQPLDQAPPAAAAEPNPPPATSLPPLSVPPASARIPEPQRKATASRPAPEPRATSEARPTGGAEARARTESRRPAGDWTPAAAFADREAAGRLASSIERQGYPVEIRQDGSSTRPWVVWIGSQPSGGGRRR
jgi:hypothetical protein